MKHKLLAAFLCVFVVIGISGCTKDDGVKTNRIILKVNADNAYSVSISYGKESSTGMNADNSVIKPGDEFVLCDDTSKILDSKDNAEFKVSAYTKDDILIAEEYFVITSDDKDINLELTSYQEITGGRITTEHRDLYIDASFVSDDTVSRMSDEETVVIKTDENYSRNVLLKINHTITDVTFCQLESTITDDGELIIEKGNVYHTVSKLRAGDKIVVCGDLGEFIPVKGVSFTDNDGTVRDFYIITSGESNEPLIIEY